MRNKSFFTNPLVVVTFGCAMAFAVACGDDDDGNNPAPSGGSKATGGSGSSTAGKTGSSGGSKATAGSSATGGEAPSTGGAPPETVGGGGAGGEVTGGAGGVGPDCTDATDNDCFKCAPTELKDFLNQCPTTGCEPFDNSALTSLKNGKLPKL